ncbi:hypothetical protein [Streptomyces sp. NPDC001781]
MTATTPDPVHLAMASAMQGLTVGYRPVPGMPGGGDHTVVGSWVRPGTGDVMLNLFRAARGSNDVDRKTVAQVTDVEVAPECVADYTKRLPEEYAKVTSA